ncbi:MAG: bifunctional (p)ppGpp synthetase/guanosine-3',5'-bis(diphosphate) 3'-pyrophosphohydrolase [Oscillospiraceae bacterium]|jgi:GTP pyrophosphokinase|nr:bifunctional (p)ppGpp synthetase/guanosine-3',5'-bis(diphosphate) 3'-pyrophosphohydrolase [Oscillospiraceae bacterium]
MDELLEGLLLTAKIHKNLNPTQIKKAYIMARDAHGSQIRHSGEPYIIHPVNVAKILINELGMDTNTIVAALLHDVLEDTTVTYEDIKAAFSVEVANLVAGITKLSTMTYQSKEETQAENVRRMFMAMAEDVRAIIIKLADRLHNMRTIEFVKEEKQLTKACETIGIYAPIAHRLGISDIKEELEDISIKVLDPNAYAEIEAHLTLNKDAREKLLQQIKKQLEDRLLGENIKSSIESRVKSIYSIYKKAYANNQFFSEINDVYAIRVILNDEIECYNILGIVHDMFPPITNRFKDYISTPKSNHYQSLHTTVMSKMGIPVEIQIRTWNMHQTAEYGIAAHWKYKTGLNNKYDEFERGITWARRLLEEQQEHGNSGDLISSIKSDFMPEEVFVFTPKGDIKNLPKGSTVIDFAYAIHSDIGNRMVGARVNGQQVALSYVVNTGEIIEIIVNDKFNAPRKDWLQLVKSSEARNKIKSWFKNKNSDANITEGKRTLAQEFKKRLINLSETQMAELISEIAANHRFKTVDEFYAALDYGGISLREIMPGIETLFQKKYYQKEHITVAQTPLSQLQTAGNRCVIVENIRDCLIKFAKCCEPIPGDDITGFVTRGHGVSVHKKNCPNVQAAKNAEQQAKWVNVSWSPGQPNIKFSVGVEVISYGRPGMLADIASRISAEKILIHSVDAREIEDKKNSIRFTIGVENLYQLNAVTKSIELLRGVISVRRVASNFLNEKI